MLTFPILPVSAEANYGGNILLSLLSRPSSSVASLKSFNSFHASVVSNGRRDETFSFGDPPFVIYPCNFFKKSLLQKKAVTLNVTLRIAA